MRIRFTDAGHLQGNIQFDEVFDALPQNMQHIVLDLAEKTFAKQTMNDDEVEGKIREYANKEHIALEDEQVKAITDIFQMHCSIVN